MIINLLKNLLKEKTDLPLPEIQQTLSVELVAKACNVNSETVNGDNHNKVKIYRKPVISRFLKERKME